MKSFLFKRPIILAYALFVLWGVAVFFITRQSPLASWNFFVSFLFMLFWPGFSLARIFKIEFKKDPFGQVVLVLILGLVFPLVLCLIAMLAGLTLPVLVTLYLTLTVVSFILAIILDCKRPALPEPIELDYKKIFNLDNLGFILLLVALFYILVAVGVQGSDFRGDPHFHLTIVRKAFDGFSLFPQNLNFVKSSAINIAYGLPIWHIFLALITKIFHSNIFDIWGQISLPLATLAFIAWYWLIKQILPTKNLIVLTMLIWAAAAFSLIGKGYIFTRMPVPDTLGQLFLLPLLVALAIKFVSEKELDYKILIISLILSSLVAVIHMSHYFYYLTFLIVLGLTYLVLGFLRGDYVSVIKKFGIIISVNLVALGLLALFFELHGKMISETIRAFMGVQAILPLSLGLPPLFLAIAFALILAFKNSKLLFLVGIGLATPLAYISSVQIWLTKILGGIFFSRLYQNMTWDFIFWGLIWGFILILIDRLISKVSQRRSSIRYLIDILLAAFTAWMIYAEINFHSISNFRIKGFNPFFANWQVGAYWWIAALLGILLFVAFVPEKYLRVPKNLLTFSEPKNQIAAFLLTIVIIFFIFSPNYSQLVTLTKYKNVSDYIYKYKNYQGVLIGIDNFGGQEAIDFIRTRIPPKQVFLVHQSLLVPISLLIDQHMVGYPDDAAMVNFQQVYNPQLGAAKKLALISQSKADYVFVTPDTYVLLFFDSYPQYFTKIFQGKVFIYEVNHNALPPA